MAGMLPDLTGPESESLPGAARADLRGLAELAFGSLSRFDESTQAQHLALLHAESLELDLTDPAQRQFGDYELREQIGEGGMGVVYRAHQRSLDREVALKLLSAGPWASKDFIARFEREAQNAARMQHPHIVTVFEAGSFEGLHFMSMRLVEGQSLSALLKRGQRLAPRQAALLLRTVAEAVAYAHSVGVLHLDLKPGNVLIDGNGVPYVADFGLARRLDSSTLALDNDEVSGTPSYMAPEQAQVRSSRLTTATDVWGLGAILYELLTGQPPFRGDSAQATLKLVLEGTVRAPRRLQPSVPSDLQAIALRCLGRDTAERYPSARALADDLARYLDGRPVLARPLNVLQRSARWARRDPKLAATALLAFGLLTGGLIATTQQWRRADANAKVAQVNAEGASQRLWDSRDAASLALMESGDGWNAAPLLLANLSEMEARGEHEGAVGMRKRLGILNNTNPRLIDVWPVQKETSGIAFSPDARMLALSGVETGVRLFDVPSGKELLRTMSHEGQANSLWMMLDQLRFAPDGRSIVATSTASVETQTRPAAFGMLRLDTVHGTWLDPPATFADFLDASYDPAGSYALLTGKTGRSQFWATDPWQPLSPLAKVAGVAGAEPKLIAPDGNFFALGGAAHAVTLVDARTLSVRAHVDLGSFGSIAAWAISPDSRWLALGDGEGHVVVVNCTTRAVRTLQPQGFHRAQWITFSDDGGWLAVAAGAGGAYLWSWPEGRLLAPPFSGNPSPSGAPTAEQVALDRTHNMVLTSDDQDNTTLWQIAPPAYAADRRDAVQTISRINARRTERTELVAWSTGQGLLASVSRDRLRLERLPPLALKSGHGAPLRPGTLRFDGHRLVVVEGHRATVVDARSERPLGGPFEFGQPPGFAELTPDGATLVVLSGRMLHAVDVATGKPRFAPVALADSPAHVDISPDGKRLMVAWKAHEPASERVASEVAELHDLTDGKRLAGPVELPGVANDMAFSADGTRFLAWNRRDLMLRDGHTLAPIEGPLKNFRPRGTDLNAHHGYMHYAVFDGANGVQMIFGRSDGAQWHYELRRYAASGKLSSSPLPNNTPNAILPLTNGRTAVFSGYDSTSVIDAQGKLRSLPVDIDLSTQYAGAVSLDGRWLARVRSDGVALSDLRDNSRVITLRVALPRPDQVWQIAFSADGNALLARTMHGRQIVWNLEPDVRPVAAIARELALRDRALVAGIDGDAGRDPDAAERASLRARDPGPAYDPVPAAPEPVARLLPGGPIPQRDPAAPPELLDLSPFYTFGLSKEFLAAGYPSGDFSWLAQGVQRLLGVDYDLRGGVRLVPGASMRFDLASWDRPGVLGAIDALVLSDDAVDSQPFALARLDYADGTHAEIPLNLGKNFGEYWRKPDAEQFARIAAVGWDSRWYGNSWQRSFALAVRVPNPHRERPVKTLTLSNPIGAGGAPVVLAVTLEPASAVRISSGKD